MNNKIKLTTKFFNQNPYEEGTTYWHTYMDMFLKPIQPGSEISLEELKSCHGLSSEYYETTLPVLELDGLIERETMNNNKSEILKALIEIRELYKEAKNSYTRGALFEAFESLHCDAILSVSDKEIKEVMNTRIDEQDATL